MRPVADGLFSSRRLAWPPDTLLLPPELAPEESLTAEDTDAVILSSGLAQDGRSPECGVFPACHRQEPHSDGTRNEADMC